MKIPRRPLHLALALVALAGGWAGRAWAREPIVTRFNISDNRIAITFDACATKTHGYGFDRPVYRVLQRQHVPATIFVSGRWVEFHPGVMTELSADPLIEFGDHSYDHPHMTRLTSDDMAREIDETEAALGRYGKHGVAFRPPFGDFNARMLDVVRGRGLPVVSWDVVSGDPAAATTAQGMIREVERRTRPGSIVIFHINGRGWKTAEALPTILHALKERGFTFVHLSDLLGAPLAPASAASPPVEIPTVEPPVEPAPAGTLNIEPSLVAPPPAARLSVEPPPFVARPVHPAPHGPSSSPPPVVEAAGHAPTDRGMRWGAEEAKRVSAAPVTRP